ncbi:MAG: magnesium transporter [Clostridia bacterium]|nr:magnesium transporter [Clostridia bacterium]
MNEETITNEAIAEEIEESIKNKKYPEIRRLLADIEPQDIAIIFESLPEEIMPVVFRLLPKTTAADCFSEMSTDVQEMLIRRFSDAELKNILDEMYIDDTVDVIEEMPANVVKRILANCDSESRQQINDILKYPKDSAGSIMTVEYVRLDKNMTIEDAFARIRRTGTDKETIYTCYVTESDKTLVGVVTAMDLMLNDTDKLISEIMDTNVISVTTDEDKEQVASKMSKYDFLAIPVVDVDNHLVGIVTFDDAIDVIQEVETEDITKMAAFTPTDKPYFKTGVFSIWLSSIPWLMLLMLSATFTGAIISHYELALSHVIILTSFIPMLMDTAGNAGGQASVTIIRAISLGEVEPKDVLRVVWKEFRVSFLCGVSLAAVGFGKAVLVDKAPPMVALVVCLTLATTVVAAKIVGCCMPLLIKRLKFDPAVVASPFITTIVDALSLLVYFAIASAILPELANI